MPYWDLGRQIVEKQENAKWGSGFLEQLSKDLKAEFPEMTGFTVRNLQYCKTFFAFYTDNALNDHAHIITKQPVSQLSSTQNQMITNRQQVVDELQQTETQDITNRHQVGDELLSHDNQIDTILQQLAGKSDSLILHQAGVKFDSMNLVMVPWGHHIKIMQKVKKLPEALFYIEKTIENNWSRAVLEYHIQTNLYKTAGKAKTNFKLTLPEPDSDLAIAHVKSEYNFEFLQMSDRAKESELEKGLLNHIRDFLLELGKGFAYMGSQYPIKVGQRDFKIDLLFYHAILSCYVVIELKVKEFEPEHTGKLGFYVSAVDKYLKKPKDNPTIGILLCMDKDDDVVDLSLQSVNSPVGVSIFRYKELTEETKALLPTEEELLIELENFEKEKADIVSK